MLFGNKKVSNLYAYINIHIRMSHTYTMPFRFVYQTADISALARSLDRPEVHMSCSVHKCELYICGGVESFTISTINLSIHGRNKRFFDKLYEGSRGETMLAVLRTVSTRHNTSGQDPTTQLTTLPLSSSSAPVFQETRQRQENVC